MTTLASRWPISLDLLIAEAKRRARQRRVLVALAVVLVVAGGAGAAFRATTSSDVWTTTGPRPVQSALAGGSTGLLKQMYRPRGHVFRPRFGIPFLFTNRSSKPIILERVRVVLAAPTGPHTPVGQIGERFEHLKPPPPCRTSMCGSNFILASRPMVAATPTPLRLAPGQGALGQLNFRLLGCSRRQAQEVVALQKITAIYRLPNGSQIQQEHDLIPPSGATTHQNWIGTITSRACR